MPEQKILHKFARFRAETAGCTQTVRPTLSDSDLIGTVLSVSLAKEPEEAIFDKPVGGKWVDWDAVNQRDREVFTVTVGELSQMFWDLLRSSTTTSYVPGSTITKKGWLQIITKDDSDDTIDDLRIWTKADITTHEMPQTGYVTAQITFRKLYSGTSSVPLNIGTLTNIV